MHQTLFHQNRYAFHLVDRQTIYRHDDSVVCQ